MEQNAGNVLKHPATQSVLEQAELQKHTEAYAQYKTVIPSNPAEDSSSLIEKNIFPKLPE